MTHTRDPPGNDARRDIRSVHSGASYIRRADPHVLVVDDSAEARDLYRELLGFYGFRIDCADSGAAGLAQALADPPDVIVLDFSMPGMDGGEVLRRLDSDARTRAIPVVMVTAVAELVSEECRSACADLLEKPCELDRLLRTLTTLVEQPNASRRSDLAPRAR